MRRAGGLCLRAPGVSEAAGEAALYAGTPDSGPLPLADAMQRIGADPLLRSHHRALGLERAGHLTWEDAADRLLHVMQHGLLPDQ